MEFKGTKGKWELRSKETQTLGANNDEGFYARIITTKRTSIDVWGHVATKEETEANAQAISAVPEMIAALQIAVRAYQELGVDPKTNCYKQAEAALNKALNLTPVKA